MQLQFEAIDSFAITALSLGACVMVRVVSLLNCHEVVLWVAQPIV